MDFGDKNVKLETKEISVEYKVIDKKIPHLFKKHNPIVSIFASLYIYVHIWLFAWVLHMHFVYSIFTKYFLLNSHYN